ncbi:15836_t:CDS:2, partial [Gigaspora rosea]
NQKQFLCGDDNFKFENSGDLDETKEQFLDKDKYNKESCDVSSIDAPSKFPDGGNNVKMIIKNPSQSRIILHGF